MILLLLTGVSPAASTDRHSLASIVLQAEGFLSEYPWTSPYPPEFEIQALDSRLKLAPCASGLAIGFNRPDKTTGQTSLDVRCPGPVQWRIHLPVRVSLYDDALVARVPLLRGQRVDPNQVKRRKVEVTQLQHGYFSQPIQLRHMQAARNLKTGAILTTANLQARNLVESGQRITIVLDFNGLSVKTSGMALQSAGMGQPVKVRNLQSQRVVEGIVSGSAEVRVSL
jgi:flagella basal body P-ring formation protein FlgA